MTISFLIIAFVVLALATTGEGVLRDENYLLDGPEDLKPCKNPMGWPGLCQNGLMVGCGLGGTCWRQCERASRAGMYCLPIYVLNTRTHNNRCKTHRECVEKRTGFRKCRGRGPGMPKGPFCMTGKNGDGCIGCKNIPRGVRSPLLHIP